MIREAKNFDFPFSYLIPIETQCTFVIVNLCKIELNKDLQYWRTFSYANENDRIILSNLSYAIK